MRHTPQNASWSERPPGASMRELPTGGNGRRYPWALLLLGACLLGVSLQGLAGCSPALERVKPWERGELASDRMRPDLNTLQDLNWSHIQFSKEATPLEPGGGGGGCGCN